MLLVLLLLSGVLHAQAFKWEPCDADKVPFVPDNVALVPDPPVIGSQVTFNIKGSNAGMSAFVFTILPCLPSLQKQQQQ